MMGRGGASTLVKPLAIGLALLLLPVPEGRHSSGLNAGNAAAQGGVESKKRRERAGRKADDKATTREDLGPGESASPSQAAGPQGDAPVPGATLQPVPKEKIEADVSTRSIAVTPGFIGQEIVVFGSVDNSRQPSAEAGYYDVIVVVEGTRVPVVARQKSHVTGLWINTSSAVFDHVPSYYAIASTRPLEEIAEPAVLEANKIGMEYALISSSMRSKSGLSAEQLKAFRDGILRVKEDDELYFRADYGVAFIGRGLFRSTIKLPPNVPVGPLTARVSLFREGELLSAFETKVVLEREGIERLLYEFAMRYPLIYGLFAVALAAIAGLIASAFFRRPRGVG